MAEVGSSGMSPDVSLLYGINGLAVRAPDWFDHIMAWVGEYGIIGMLGVLMIGAWWSVRKRGERAPGGVALLVWAPIAAGLALLINIPIRDFVERPRPFVDHRYLEVLAEGKTDYSFVSDHATLAMALAVGIFVAHRALGSVALALACLEGFCRVYMGVHYPTDVLGGFALGTAVVLLLAPLAAALLTPLTQTVAASPAGWLVRGQSSVTPDVALDGAGASADAGGDHEGQASRNSDGKKGVAA